MRLIDAEDLKARAREEIGGLEEPFASHFAVLVEWLVDKTATAYDVEKVVEQIRAERIQFPDCLMERGFNAMARVAEEIVRKGGVE